MGCVSSDELERIKFKQYKYPPTKKINRTKTQKQPVQIKVEEDDLKPEEN